jgi:pimeloyl-ACP methyl ester carboxylesterase
VKENIVLVHGMWCGSWVWDSYKRFFEEKGYSCHTPVLRYHDVHPSDKPNPALGTTSILDYANDLEKYISHLDNESVIIGHSLGGLLTQIIGARGLGKALVLISPVSPAGIDVPTYSVVKSVWKTFARWGFWKKHHRISYEIARYSILNLLPEEEQKNIYENFVYESGRVSSEIAFWQFDRKRATKVDESKLSQPLLVIVGSEDRITPSIFCQRIAEKYSNVSTYKMFDNHAHWIIGESGWENIAAFILTWIYELSD